MSDTPVMLATITLNEIEWLERFYIQHKDWVGLVKWVFVEGADIYYAKANPHLVSSKGLSTDGSTEYLEELSRKDDRIVYIQHGFCQHENPAQGKCELRNRYLEVADKIKPTYIITADDDEFWSKANQIHCIEYMNKDKVKWAYSFRHREIWHPPSVSDEPLMKYEVVGGFWDILYCRGWRWIHGMRYVNNHNTPVTISGIPMDRSLKDHRKRTLSNMVVPQFVHMGFASDPIFRKAKNSYYKERGEGITDHRKWYVESRDAFATWKPGDTLPRGAVVMPYTGEIPECFA